MTEAVSTCHLPVPSAASDALLRGSRSQGGGWQRWERSGRGESGDSRSRDEGEDGDDIHLNVESPMPPSPLDPRTRTGVASSDVRLYGEAGVTSGQFVANPGTNTVTLLFDRSGEGRRGVGGPE